MLLFVIFDKYQAYPQMIVQYGVIEKPSGAMLDKPILPANDSSHLSSKQMPDG